jgi:hypothetical protein
MPSFDVNVNEYYAGGMVTWFIFSKMILLDCRASGLGMSLPISEVREGVLPSSRDLTIRGDDLELSNAQGCKVDQRCP